MVGRAFLLNSSGAESGFVHYFCLRCIILSEQMELIHE